VTKRRAGTYKACSVPFMTDALSTLYQDLLSGSYDCVDRIVLNAYFRMGHDPGGFRVWLRLLTGSDHTLENTHLIRMAGRFSRRIRGYAKVHNMPVIECSAGDRKHDIAEEYLAKTKVTQGVFLILVGRAQAPVWDASANHHLERKKPMPHVVGFGEEGVFVALGNGDGKVQEPHKNPVLDSFATNKDGAWISIRGASPS